MGKPIFLSDSLGPALLKAADESADRDDSLKLKRIVTLLTLIDYYHFYDNGDESDPIYECTEKDRDNFKKQPLSVLRRCVKTKLEDKSLKEQLQDALNNLVTTLETLTEGFDVENIDVNDNLANFVYKAVVERMNLLRDRLRETIERNAGLEKEIQQTIERNAGIEKELQQTIERNAGLEKELQQTIERNARLEEELQQNEEKANEQTKKHEDVTTKLHQEFKEIHDELRNEVRRVASENELLTKQLKSINERSYNHEHIAKKATAEAERLNNRIVALEEEKKDLEKYIEELRGSLEDQKTACAQMANKFKLKMEALEVLKEEKEALENNLDEQIENETVQQQRLRSCENNLNELEEELTAAKKEVELKQVKIEELEQQQIDIEQLVKECDDKVADKVAKIKIVESEYKKRREEDEAMHEKKNTKLRVQNEALLEKLLTCNKYQDQIYFDTRTNP